MTHTVRDGVRTRVFSGELLAISSSQDTRKDRWIEFRLYRTVTNQYVVSRIGYSRIFHSADCGLVRRNHLSPVDGLELTPDYIACYECRPSRGDIEGVFPETPRYAAWVCTDPLGVVSSLMKEDRNGVEYLTNVARRLLEKASEADSEIEDAYLVDRIE